MLDNKSAFSSNVYDENINKVLPFYNEFHNQIIDVVRTLELDSFQWLDIGCGTGTLAEKASKMFQNCRFTLCDISENMLDIAKERLKFSDNTVFSLCSSDSIDYKKCFDVVTAVQVNHYFDEEQRKKATENCFNALKSGGIYITFENVAMSALASEQLGIKRWAGYMTEQGKTDSEIKVHMSRRGKEFFPITVKEHLNLLESVGFKSVDILWASYTQAGFIAIK